MSRLWIIALSTGLVAAAASAQVVRYENAVVFGSKETALTTSGTRLVPNTTKPDRTVDLKGAFVVPRLVDGHGHLLSLGRSLFRIDLVGTNSYAQVIQRVIAGAGDGQSWVFGRGWDQNDWEVKAFPTHGVLSEAFPRRPVVLRRVDGHAVLVNAEAMKRAGITGATKDPPDGRILRDAAGEPTGVLIDGAMTLVNDVVPAPTSAERRKWILAAVDQCLATGLTGMHDMGMDRETIAVLTALDIERALKMRVYAYTSGVIEGQRPYTGHNFSVVGVKLFADGALGSRGASLHAPYSDDPDNSGLLLTPPDTLAARVQATRAAGLQPAIHAIGDRGISTAIAALRKHPGPTPGRVEHAQVIAPGDFAAFDGGKIVASMQPTHATSDMPWAEDRVGPERIEGAYAWRTLLNRKAHLVFGSDFPVESHDVRKGLYAAVTRQDPDGRPAQGWMPKQRVTMSEALTAFSTAAAEAVGDRTSWADFAVYARDLRNVAPSEIPKVSVIMVVVGGVEVFSTKQR